MPDRRRDASEKAHGRIRGGVRGWVRDDVRARPRRVLGPLGGLLTLVLLASGCGTYGNWPDTTRGLVPPLDHPSVGAAAEDLPRASASLARAASDCAFTFVAYGDQRALADGEWQAMTAEIGRLATTDSTLLCVIDSGDIVQDGRFADQFEFLNQILAPLRGLPYLVAVGNHELHNNDRLARRQTARFLAPLDPEIGFARLYYRKDVAPVSFLFLDTNDLVYGLDGDGPWPAPPNSDDRAARQLRWLMDQLADRGDAGPLQPTVVVVMHHPFLQSSQKHHEAAVFLWNFTWDGRRLPDIMLDGGVDLVIVGHTHTYERFQVRRRSDGRSLRLVNLSGRPRAGFLFFGAGARRARDLAGREFAWLAEHGWRHLDAYDITQEQAMTGVETNQFGVFSVSPDGGIAMVLRRQDPAAPSRFAAETPVRIVAGN